MGYHYTKTMRAIYHASAAPVMTHRPALYRVALRGLQQAPWYRTPRGSTENRTPHELIYSQPCHLDSSTPVTTPPSRVADLRRSYQQGGTF